MSIINKVLKDLDKRGSQPFGNDHASSAVATSSRRSVVILVVFLLVTLAAAIVATYYFVSQDKQAVLEPAKKAAGDVSVEPKPYKPISTQVAASDSEAIESEQPDSNEPSVEPERQTEQAAIDEVPTSSEVDDQTVVTEEPKEAQQETPTMVKEAVTLTPAQLAAQHAEKATAAQQQGRLDDAEKHWQKALLVLPNDSGYRQQLAALQYGRGKISQALVTLNEGLQRRPTAHELRLLSAKILQKEGQLETALLLLQKATPEASEYTDYYQLQASLAQQLERFQLAANSYRRLRAAQPNQGRWYLGEAIALEQFDSTQALSVYRQALPRLTHPPSQDFVRQRIQQLEQNQ